jgi:hypothetical protein
MAYSGGGGGGGGNQEKKKWGFGFLIIFVLKIDQK